MMQIRLLHNRNFLLGLGAGLLAASLVFGVSSLLRSQPAAVPQALPEKTVSPQQPAAAQSPTGVSQPSAGEAVAAPAKVKVEIKKGMTAAEIADLLVKSGVITDAQAFLDKAREKVRRFRDGVYELPVKGDDGLILDLITSGSGAR